MAIAGFAVRSQPADLEAAAEFHAAVAEKLAPGEWESIVAELAAKSARVQAAFARLAAGEAGAEQELLAETFATRRRLRELSATTVPSELAVALAALGDTAADPCLRADAFSVALVGAGAGITDLAWELMHFLEPESVCLATAWVWNPDTETGALKLLLDEDYDLFGEDASASYGRLAFASGYVAHAARAAGMLGEGPLPFETDVLLAGVYGVYMGTVLAMRMTKEFNKILPPLGQLMRKLLGLRNGERS
ncbi:MAG: hypothetical protein M0000_11625 [Actinomycetota bacterium]|nr:hypothetical protein [Actinomycetota bacterium]